MRVAIAMACVLVRPAFAGDCLQGNDERAALDAWTRATAANDKRYDEAVAKRKLEPVQLPSHRVVPDDHLAAPAKEDDTATLGTLRLVVETSISDCEPVKPPFARRGDKIFRLRRAPRARSTKQLAICACFGGTHCGGRPKPTYALGYFELPAGTEFAGVLDIVYESDDVVIHGTHQCPAPP